MKLGRARRGLTVIELVVVIALIGMMASVVAPSLFSFEGSGAAETTIDRVEALIRFGRTAAIERAQRVVLTIDPGTGRFWLDVPDTTGMIAPAGESTLISPAKRVHIHFQVNGDASIDDALLVREGATTRGIVVDR